MAGRPRKGAWGAPGTLRLQLVEEGAGNLGRQSLGKAWEGWSFDRWYRREQTIPRVSLRVVSGEQTSHQEPVAGAQKTQVWGLCPLRWCRWIEWNALPGQRVWVRPTQVPGQPTPWPPGKGLCCWMVCHIVDGSYWLSSSPVMCRSLAASGVHGASDGRWAHEGRVGACQDLLSHLQFR